MFYIVFCYFVYRGCLECCTLFCVMSVIMCDVCHCIVLYCTVLYCPVLHCSTLPPGLNPFAVDDDDDDNNNNNKSIPALLDSKECFIIN